MSGGGVSSVEGRLAKQEAGGGVLAEDRAFTAFPWVKAAGRDEIECVLRATGQIVKGGQFDGGIVALQNKLAMCFEEGETLVKREVAFLGELVVFADEAGVGGIELKGASVDKQQPSRRRAGGSSRRCRGCDRPVG